jgi:hypothetical protein
MGENKEKTTSAKKNGGTKATHALSASVGEGLWVIEDYLRAIWIIVVGVPNQYHSVGHLQQIQ